MAPAYPSVGHGRRTSGGWRARRSGASSSIPANTRHWESVKRITLHRRLGLAGIVVAFAAFVIGVLVNVRIASRAMAADSSERTQDMLAFAAASLVGLLPFVPLIVLALWYVRRPAVHKRLMFWAFAWMLGPAFTNTRPLGRVLVTLAGV